MKSQRLGLQPIKNYERVVNPQKKRFHMSSRMNSHGKNIITKIADYEGNYVKESGLLEGDEIIAINEIPIKMITIEENTKLNRRDTLDTILSVKVNLIKYRWLLIEMRFKVIE